MGHTCRNIKEDRIVKKKRCALRWKLLLCILLTSLYLLAAGSMPAQAAEKGYMKKIKGISWDLAKGKTTKYHIFCTGIGYATETVKISGIKTKKNPKKKGYKTTTIKFIFDERWKISRAKVDKIFDSASGGYWGTMPYTFVVDYDTGTNLEEENAFNVSVSTKQGKFYSKKTYYGSTYVKGGKEYQKQITLGKVNVTVKITYPEEYKGLCILAGGATKLISKFSKQDNAFLNGKALFGKATALYSKKDKKYCHAMRIGS